MTDDLKIETRRDGPLLISTLAGEARLEQIARLTDDTKKQLGAGAKHVLLGCSGLRFVDSASLGAFIEIGKECAAGGGSLVLFGVTPRLRRIMKAMGLESRFKTAADEASARTLV